MPLTLSDREGIDQACEDEAEHLGFDGEDMKR
jgi:hypothetical protein